MAASLLAFIGASLLLAMVPGPTTAVLLRQVLRAGRRTACLTVAGSQLGLPGWSVATAVGLPTLLVARIGLPGVVLRPRRDDSSRCWVG